MQNESFEFLFCDKTDVDEKSFFLLFLPHLSRPEEVPELRNPFIEGFIAGMRGDKSPPSGQEDYASVPEVFYAATYNHATGRLEVNVVTQDDDPEAEPGTLNIRSDDGDTTTAIDDLDGAMRYEPLADDAWDVFYEHATFDEILKSIDPDGGDSVLVKMHKFDGCTDEHEKTRLALQIIRDSPKMLLGDKFATELIETLEKARWSTDKYESEKALNLLKDNFLPIRPGGKIPLPPNVHAIRAVMEALAKHLSDKCRFAINEDLEVSLGKGEGIDEDLYAELISWARRNKEFRISRLPRTELNSLIFKPKTHANDLLKSHLRTSIKTMSRNNA